MSDSDVKQVKVDNWGIYFLQRLKHFFNRTDYCDLTLQFQDNAQLKVHRLVLSACTEYFELLERTCEMYEDCLVMPDDLQADVVVPIVNFMYTGQLEFRADSLERLYQTSQIMNMPVLTKLLDAHRKQPVLSFNPIKRSYSKPNAKMTKPVAIVSSNNAPNKRSYSKAFGNTGHTVNKEKKQYITPIKNDMTTNNGISYASSSAAYKPATSKKVILGEPRPTRYELPEELDTDNIFDNSFSHISYTSQPLMVHPEATKHYPSKRSGIFNEASTSNKYAGNPSTVDIVECKKVSRHNRDNIFEDELPDLPISDEAEMFSTSNINLKSENPKVSNQLFDQILDHGGPRVTIETKDNKPAANIDHAKIISEVLKKYPHLVKSNKNIKLKILNTPSTPKPPSRPRKQQNSPTPYHEETDIKLKTEVPDFTYETDVLDSKEAAKLIAMGAENVKGPWICLICGTPGRALHFTSYYKFRRHLVEVHNEKPVSNICEYCGLKSLKRNYLLHHLYTKHGVEPPPSYRFPKCNLCSYVALTEGFLVKHKLTHTEHKNFRCNVCASQYHTSKQLLAHIQSTGHKYSADRRTNLQCIYCLKVFLREGNLYAHLKTNHKHAAKSDGIIEDSDEDRNEEHMLHASPTSNPEPAKPAIVKYEPQNYENDFEDMETQYEIQQRPDGNIQLLAKKPRVVTSVTPTKQKILNTGFNLPIVKSPQKVKFAGKNTNIHNDFLQEVSISPNVNTDEEIVMIDNNEYIMRDNQLILKKKANENEYNMVSDIMTEVDQPSPTTSMQYANIHDEISEDIIPEEKVLTKKPDNLNQPIQFVVSSEEEYKALMNSNHSIIFDDGDINKTLTVLSAPHNTTLNATAVDLDNAQSNDMMIIPNPYPLNVSEAIPTDNSNIVVVYSHPVDEQDKQYQLITSQDIGAQFVQTSAVITQNFGAITTSTPVMSAHVIDSQAAETWQNNVPENIDNQEVEMTTPAELHEIAIVEQAEITSIESETNNGLHEFPEVTLASEESQENVIQESEMSENLSNNINTEGVEEHVEQTIVEETQPVLTPMDFEVQSETVTVEDTHADKSSQNIIENNPHGDVHTETLNISEEQPIDESNVEHGHEEIVEATESINEENPKSENIVIETANIEEEAGNSHAQSGSVQIVNINNEEVTLTKVTTEQIQTLASEWSEDEDETEVQKTNDTEENKSKCGQENEIPATETSGEVEESIENIQQEMEKQITESTEEAVTEDSENTPLQEDSAAEHEQAQSETIIVAKPPPEKLSSILNDWEDSQEENDSTNENEENVSTQTEQQNVSLDTIECVSKEAEDADIEKDAQKNDDKIKNLVSDWDDEEEENKN